MLAKNELAIIVRQFFVKLTISSEFMQISGGFPGEIKVRFFSRIWVPDKKRRRLALPEKKFKLAYFSVCDTIGERDTKGASAMVIHESAEDYLESILILQERLGQVRSIDIVNELGYSKPSVSIAMKKLRESGYITMESDGRIFLNESGQKIADQVYNRHRTLTRLFTLLGVSPEIAAEDACRVEHDLNEETFARIREFVAKASQK